MVFAFDNERFLNIWIFNEDFVFKKAVAAIDTIFTLVIEFLKMVNVSVDCKSSFKQIVSVVNTYIPIFPLEILSRKPKPKCSVEKNPSFDGFRAQEISRKLFQILIDPEKDILKGSKLIVVPDRQLFFAPFPSLIDENGCFVTSKYSIQITPSLHTLKASMERVNEPNFGFALFIGNPTVGKISLNDKEFTPLDLPGAGEEVESLAKLFDATPLLRHKAKKQVVMQHLSEASIIHIAAYGEPSKGEIMLAPNSSHDLPCSSVPKPDSYLLTQRDITSISVQARLVVLCCCYSGQGEVSSEGVVGITRSFLAAGARSVLATLWPINDKATKEFMEEFYNELCNETPVCEALRRTMNLFQKHKKHEYRSSRIWAPFTIYGEDVKFEKVEIEKIKEKSRDMFSDSIE